ncbi:MAG: hypothetical protein AB7K52_11780 [Phycisphaerales bacterium]
MNRRAITLSTFALSLCAGLAHADQCPTLDKLGNFFTPGASDQFGASLSMSFGGLNNAPLLAVGRPNDDPPISGDNAGGFAVYQKINGWSLMYDSFNTTGQGGERLGHSIGLSDPYLIAGAPGFSNTGRARIYRRPSNGSGYTGPVDVYPSLGGAGSGFGNAVAVSSFGGGWAVVGAPFHDFHGEVDAGAAFFFVRNDADNTWTQAYQIWGGDFLGETGGHRGEAVAMSQSSPFAAVGAPNHDQNGSPTDHGAVRVVMRLANGLPSGQSAYIVPPSPEANEHFGSAVAIEGDLLVVGSPDEDMTLQEGGFIQAATNGGAIYIYQRTGEFNTWEFVTKLRSPTPSANARFGAKVATDGNMQVVVSEPGTKRTYLYSRDGGTWHYQAALSDPDSVAAGSFGNAVAVRSGDIAVADEMDDHTSTTDAGAVYVTSIDPDVVTGDLCSNPIPVPAGNYIGCTENATASPFVGTTCGTGGGAQGPDVFFIFQPECSGNAIFDTFGSDFDTVLSVHSACPNNFGDATIVCNDDASFAAPNNRASLVTFNFTGGETYLIRVSGYGGAKGQFTLRHLYTFGVPNDTCATATTVGLGTVNTNTCAATGGLLSTTCAQAVFRDVWYRFIAPQAGAYRFTTCTQDAGFDTVLTVYNGTQQSCPSTTGDEIACNDDAPGHPCNPLNSRLTVNAAAGQSMLIRVAGYVDADHGAVALTIDRPFICAADFNGDGSLDPDDLGDYINCYFSQPPCPMADFNADGNVDPDDLGDFINAYFTGCP